MRPEDESELSEAVAASDGPLRIAGGATRPVGRQVDGALLSTTALSGIRRYEPGAMTLIAGAGTPLAAIEAALARERQCLPFEPMDHRQLLSTDGEPTIGGAASANASGPRRVRVGACRDHMLGIRFVDGRGRVLKNGGRVMKNVTGYDLVKLLAGSFGTLGVLTEIAFKVLPRPEFRAVLLYYGLEDAAAVRALSVALGSPFAVTGAAHAPRGLDGHPATMIRIEGFEDAVRTSAKRLAGQLGEFGDALIEDDQERIEAGWKWVRDVERFRGLPGDVWRVSARPTEGPELVQRVRRHCDPEVMYDWGGGLVWLLVPGGTDLRGWLGGFEGYASIVRASRETRERVPPFHPSAGGVQRIQEALKERFDPRGILNPGLMFFRRSAPQRC